ncbi:histidine phosphatase family protein [Fulvimarina sp. 2208YS6-2-32]|uniref:Histidine phosphatase family protein n=1 Tax=Fulvimarina uroteuthidis TaxID=3098149 RepID=A0ABU5I223_9HYPH|nr:histidine phosphatase family protein [Fulvimarina sp. 2208YS6-2-32]MDY8109197.1 histidine phosphatase family protein [Fulvimarina sp. 2208YS6-2-32]
MVSTPHRLFILRHAHSSWALPGQRDHQRNLDDRGREEAARLADAIEAEAIEIDCAHCSTASRARETFDLVKPAFKAIARTELSDDLYGLGPEAYIAAMCADPDARTVLVIGHNPMIEDFALSLVPQDSKAYAKLREGLPTCGFIEFSCAQGFKAMADGGGTMERILLPHEMA